MKTVQQENSGLLAKRSSLTSEICLTRIEKTNGRLKEISARFEDINPNVGYGLPGPERKRIAETGSTEDMVALNTEQAELEAEQQALQIQSDAFVELRESTAISEAPSLARAAIKSLTTVLRAAAKTSAAHKKNLAKLEALATELLEARTIADRGAVKCPALGPGEFNDLAELTGWFYASLQGKDRGNINANRYRWQSRLCGPTEPAKRSPYPPGYQ